MRARRFMLVVFGLLAAFAGAPPAGAAISGHTDWKAWRFDWEIKDGAGVAIRNVTYDGELVIYKGSMPAIRVKYAGDACGPFTDRLTEYSLKSTVCSPDVCQRSYTLGGHEWLEVGIMEQIGGYEIYQAWYLSDDGQIQPHLWSRRYHCQVTHDHHAYWRLDIDVRGFPRDQIFVFDSNRPNEGWGPGWHKYPTEVNDLKSPGTRRKWFVRDDTSSHGVWLMPGRADGNPDTWSNRDMSGRLYHYQEDGPWAFNEAELGYDNGEDIQEKDVIFWYVAHLHHDYPGDPDEWHHAGPILRVHR